eukprot:1138713-Pelagomonas_calceolata.AAC.4
MAGNECAGTVAKYQGSLKDNTQTNTSSSSAGPGGKSFYILLGWLEKRQDRVHLNLPPPFPI